MGSPGLNAAELRAWRAFAASSRLLYDALDRNLQREAGIPLAYYEILARLSESTDGGLRMSSLAEQALASRSRLSHAVATLEKRGWVRREGCPTDGRGAIAVLTEAGSATLKAAAAAHVKAVRSYVFDSLSPEQVGHLEDVGNALMTCLLAAPSEALSAGAA